MKWDFPYFQTFVLWVAVLGLSSTETILHSEMDSGTMKFIYFLFLKDEFELDWCLQFYNAKFKIEKKKQDTENQADFYWILITNYWSLGYRNICIFLRTSVKFSFQIQNISDSYKISKISVYEGHDWNF